MEETVTVIGNAFIALVVLVYVAGMTTVLSAMFAKSKKHFKVGLMLTIICYITSFIFSAAVALCPYYYRGMVGRDMLWVNMFVGIVLSLALLAASWKAGK
jgi:hypothetical protein